MNPISQITSRRDKAAAPAGPTPIAQGRAKPQTVATQPVTQGNRVTAASVIQDIRNQLDPLRNGAPNPRAPAAKALLDELIAWSDKGEDVALPNNDILPYAKLNAARPQLLAILQEYGFAPVNPNSADIVKVEPDISTILTPPQSAKSIFASPMFWLSTAALGGLLYWVVTKKTAPKLETRTLSGLAHRAGPLVELDKVRAAPKKRKKRAKKVEAAPEVDDVEFTEEE